MTGACRNCGAEVSDRYVRVFSVDGDGVDCCPDCDDLIRTNGTIRERKT